MALLLALCLLVSLVPMTAFAEAGDWDPTMSSGNIRGSINAGMSSTASTSKYLGAGDIQLKVMPTTTIGNATYNAMAYCGVTAVSSNPSVASVKENGIGIGTWQGGDFNGADALQVLVTPNSVGTTVVSITFYYTFSQSANPFTNRDAKWFLGSMRYTVQVKDPDAKPAGPTEADAKRFRNYVNSTSSSKGAVYIWCEANLNDHGAWFDYLTDVPNGYSFGEVVKNDGRNTNAPASDYPWMCIMTVNHNAYLNAYNEELGDKVGTHYLKYPKTTTTEVAWFYGDNGWVYQASNAPVYIDVVHEKVREEFTVTYTDGVADEEVFADEVYTVKEDDATPAFQGKLERKGYVFAGWTPAVTDTVTETVVYTATWKEDRNNNGVPDEDEEKFTVTYTDGVDGEEVFADEVYADLLSGDATPAFQGKLERKGYVFAGWTPAVTDTVTETVVYTAIWKEDRNNNGVPDEDEEKFTVTYTDGVDGVEVFADQVYADLLSGDATPAFQGKLERKGYVFAGWTPVVTDTVTETVVYTATWKEDRNNNGVPDEDEEKFTVTYTDGVDGVEVFADQVYADLLSGDATPAFQGKPERDGYDFKGWNPQVADTVSESVVYTAVWEAQDNGNDTPKTGDGANLTLWISLMAVAALGAAAVVLVEKKKHAVNK